MRKACMCLYQYIIYSTAWLVSIVKRKSVVVVGKLKACGVTGALLATFGHKNDLIAYIVNAYEVTVLLALKNIALKHNAPLSKTASASNGTSLHSF